MYILSARFSVATKSLISLLGGTGGFLAGVGLLGFLGKVGYEGSAVGSPTSEVGGLLVT